MTSALQTAISEFNLTGTFSKMNVYQGYSSCELYPDGTTKALLTHAFNGKDFLSLDVENKRYIASVPEASKYKRIRERNIILLETMVSFYKTTCFDRLKMFLEHAHHVNMKIAPEVRILKKQRMGSTILTCHVTGFYPRPVQVTWTGANLQLVDDEFNDVLPNGDGTYQTRRSVIRPEEDTGDQRYSCVVHHSSLREENITVIW
ncbi:class I histocompatibility antigen, F10 alpha chain-like, partial [Clarias magur]